MNWRQAKSVRTIWLIKNLLSRLKCFLSSFSVITRQSLGRESRVVMREHVGNIFRQTRRLRECEHEMQENVWIKCVLVFACSVCLKCFSPILSLKSLLLSLMKTSVIMILIYCLFSDFLRICQTRQKIHRLNRSRMNWLS